jgi:anti-sigma B factor antagonist
VSNTGWTPAVPGPTNDINSASVHDGRDPDPIVLTGEDALPDQVMDLHVERHGDVVVVRVGGEVDMLTTPHLGTSIAEELAHGPAILVLDLCSVTFLGSSGLAALVTAREDAATRGVSLRLVSAEHAVLRPLAATGLTDLFDIYDDLPAAMQL